MFGFYKFESIKNLANTNAFLPFMFSFAHWLSLLYRNRHNEPAHSQQHNKIIHLNALKY